MAYIRKYSFKKRKMFYLNTGTPLDIATGRFIDGKNGSQILNGGLAPTNGIAGREQSYKSALAESFTGNILRLYKDSSALIFDTEFAIPGEERIETVSSGTRYINNEDITDRVSLTDKSELDMDAFFEELYSIALDREKHMDDFLVEGPMLDRNTGKPALVPIPFIVLIDSLSHLNSLDFNIKDGKLSASSRNMEDAIENKIKSKFMKHIPVLSRRGAFWFMATSHITQKMEVGPIKSPRDMQYMNFTDTFRGAGKQFKAITNTLLAVKRVDVLQTSTKKCKYPNVNSSPVEINNVQTVVVRGKNNEAGKLIPFTTSQVEGVLPAVTYFHFITNDYIKKNNVFTLDKKTWSSRLFPDVSFTNDSLRGTLNDNYELNRGFDIIGQLAYMKMWWSLNDYSISSMSLDEICDKLLNNTKMPFKDMLQTRSHWTYDKKDKREYLSTLDIIKML